MPEAIHVEVVMRRMTFFVGKCLLCFPIRVYINTVSETPLNRTPLGPGFLSVIARTCAREPQTNPLALHAQGVGRTGNGK